GQLRPAAPGRAARPRRRPTADQAHRPLLPLLDGDAARSTPLAAGSAGLGAGPGRAAALVGRVRAARPRLPLRLRRAGPGRWLALRGAGRAADGAHSALERVARSAAVARD